MKLKIANRPHFQVGFTLKFKVVFICCRCKKEVEPDELLIGRRHIYALHCGIQQEIGCIA